MSCATYDTFNTLASLDRAMSAGDIILGYGLDRGPSRRAPSRRGFAFSMDKRPNGGRITFPHLFAATGTAPWF